MTNTTVTNDVFNTPEAKTDATVTTTVESYTGTVAELVGEGKKYKTVEALAASHIYANNFIETLKKEKQDVLEKLEKTVKTDELFDKLTNQTNKVEEQTTSNIPVDDLNKLIEETLNRNESKKTEIANIKITNDTLIDHFGNLAKAQEYIAAKSKELSLSTDFLMSTAAKSPLAFYNLIEVSVNKQSSNNDIMTGSTNTGSNHSTSLKIGTQEYYDNMYKTDRKRYLSPEIQKEIQVSAQKGIYFKQ